MICFVEKPEERSRITGEILNALPDWFGQPASIIAYVRECRDLPFWADMEDGKAVGFLAMNATSRWTAEIHVMGILAPYHRQGRGRRLFEAFREYAVSRGFEFLSVKTVKEGLYPDYDRTNAFYQGMGFREMECFPLLWDEANPCQVYIRDAEDRSAKSSMPIGKENS